MQVVWLSECNGELKEKIEIYIRRKDVHAINRAKDTAIAFIGREIAGLLILKIENEITELNYIEVEECFRRKGVATLLMNEALLRAKYFLYVEIPDSPLLYSFFRRFPNTQFKYNHINHRLMIHPSAQKL